MSTLDDGRYVLARTVVVATGARWGELDAGDVRAGPTKRVAGAVGDGALAVRFRTRWWRSPQPSTSRIRSSVAG